MNRNNMQAQQIPLQAPSSAQIEEPCDPVARAAYAAGAAMIVFGTLFPRAHGWTAAGVALMAFCWMYE
jgi:hypothetical protein